MRRDRQAAWVLGCWSPCAFSSGWRESTMGTPNSQTVRKWSVCWVAPSHGSVASISSTRRPDNSPWECGIHVPLWLHSVSVMTNHRFHSDPAEPLRRANMTMLSSPVRSSILTKPFAQSTANDLSPHITICLWTCIFHQTGFHQPRQQPT